MSKNARILAAAATLAIGASISTGAMVTNTSKNTKKVENTKLLVSNNKNTTNKNIKTTIKNENTQSIQEYSSTSSLLPNSIVYTNYINSANYNGINGVLLAGQISFNKNDMKINVRDWGTRYIFDGGSRGQFAKFSLFNSNLQSKYSLQTYQHQSCETINELNNKSFNYGDIFSVTQQDSNCALSFGVSNNNEMVSGYNPNIKLSTIIWYGKQTYFKITPNGLVEMNGLYKAPNGNDYYFENGQMLTNRWVNVDSQGQKTFKQVNGTTVNAYYLGANGVAEKGFQTINGHKYYFNANGIMQIGIKKIDGKVYNFGSNGILQWVDDIQISGASNISVNFGSSFNPMTGITLTDPADPNAKISVSGTVNTKVPGKYKLTYTVKDSYGETATTTREITVLDNYNISINGAKNESIKAGSDFNPMAGVKLNDQADPNAKISVSGTVNTKVPGTYKLIYTVKDNYGKTATVTREITVQNSTNIKSNTEYIYWSGNSLVINGNIDSDSTFTHSTAKKLVIMNSEGQVVDSVNTAAVNWYSSNKGDYSGFQGILSSNVLSKLSSNNTYRLYMDINGNYIPLISNANNLYNKNYLLSANSSNQLTIAKNTSTMKPINEGIGSYEVGYFINNGYVINGNIFLNNEIFSRGNTRVLLVKNAEGKVVDSINCAAMNWYSSNKNNYSGFQGIIPNSVLNKLGSGNSYTLSLEVIKDGQIYEMPINNTKQFILSTGVNYNITTNSKNNITITKAASYPVVSASDSTLESGNWEPYGYVMNIKTDIGKEIPKGTKMELISKNLNGQIVSVTPGVDVNWYSSNKNNFNGFQAMITPKQLIEASTSNKLYARVTIDGKTYESPIIGNLDTFGTGNLHYGFKTINNQINLIMK